MVLGRDPDPVIDNHEADRCIVVRDEKTALGPSRTKVMRVLVDDVRGLESLRHHSVVDGSTGEHEDGYNDGG